MKLSFGTIKKRISRHGTGRAAFFFVVKMPVVMPLFHIRVALLQLQPPVRVHPGMQQVLAQ